MSLRARAIFMILLSAYPATLWAQVASDSNWNSQSGGVAPVVYQQPDAAQAGGKVEIAPQTLSPEPVRSAEAPVPVPLKPRTATTTADSGKGPGGLQTLFTIGVSLATVLGVFLLIVWLLRRAAPGGFAPLPLEVFEPLGRASLANRQQVQLLRCGNKVLLVACNSTGGGTSTLTEITEPDEVGRLVALCRHSRAGALRAPRERENRNA